jgi:hypothetical protein
LSLRYPHTASAAARGGRQRRVRADARVGHEDVLSGNVTIPGRRRADANVC